MGKLVHESNVKVHWLPSVANKAAPTVAEKNAGTHLTPRMPSDGLATTPTRNNASIPMLEDGFVPEKVGTWSTGITLKFVRDDVTDTPWDLFGYKTPGFLLVSRFGPVVAGSKVEVYPAESHEPTPLATAENAYQQFEVQLAVKDTPNFKAVVAA